MNRFKIVLLATTFSMLFEYSMRGIGGLFHEGFFLLFFLYTSYYSLVEDLILKYRITNTQMIIIACCFGLVPEAFLTGAIFAPPLFLGINIFRFLFISIVWWGCLQGVVTFYFATRIVKRDWNHRKLGSFGWGIRLTYIAGISLLNFVRSPVLPKGSITGYGVVLTIIVLGCVYLKKQLREPQKDPYTCQKSTILDFVSFGSVCVFVILGTFVATTYILVEGSVLHVRAAQLSSTWTVIVLIGVVMYYLLHRRQITI